MPRRITEAEKALTRQSDRLGEHLGALRAQIARIEAAITATEEVKASIDQEIAALRAKRGKGEAP